MKLPEVPYEIIESSREWLRIATVSRDEEIRQVAMACLIDLYNGGVSKISLEDAAVQQAIKLYLKAQFGYDTDAVRFGEAYEHLKKALALSGEYNEVKDGEAG